MPTFKKLGYKSYEEYRKSRHWKALNSKLIHKNLSVKCFICENTRTLVIHHIKYVNLGCEKIGRDIYVICWKCHKRAHFALFTLIKLPLIPFVLRSRVRFLRAIYCVQRLRFVRAAWYFSLCVIPF